MKLKFSTSEADAVYRKIGAYIRPGTSYVLEVVRSKAKRSLPQNKYYWGVIVALFSQQTGYTSNEAHQTLASYHLKYARNGKAFVKSTTELNTFEFEQYLEKCRLFMWHELNLHVPLPNELTEDFLIQIDNIYNY